MRSIAAALLCTALLCATSCSGGSGSNVPITVSILPNVAEVLDAGQTLSINALAVQDSTGDGCTFTLSGPGTLTAAPGVFGVANQAVIYATPAVIAASTTATVTATSIHDPSKSAGITLKLYPAVTFPVQTLAAPKAGIAYSVALTASGGTGTVNFVVAGGGLPTGLTLSNAGLLSGTPTAIGTFTFLIQAQDPGTTILAGANQSFTLSVI